MLPPDFWDRAVTDISKLYGQLEETIVRDVARRIVKTGRVTDTAAWQIKQAQQSGMLYDDVIRQVARITQRSDQQIKALFEAAGVQSVAIDSEIYSAAGLSPFPLSMAPAAMQVLQANVEKTAGHLRNLTMTTASQAQQEFIRASTLAEMQVESGAFDYTTAIRNVVRSAGQSGSWVQYPTGHRDRLDVAVRRAVLTGVSQTTGQIALAYARDMGCDLMEISAHVGARPSHAKWQGQVVSLSGQIGYLSLADIGYGSGNGFKGWNCRHDWYPFFEGLSTSAYPRSVLNEYNSRTVEYNGDKISYYDATQRQREMERKIRETKRTLAGQDAAIQESSGDLKELLRADFDTTSAKLKRQEAALTDFLHQTGLHRDATRVWSSEFGRSQAQKAVWGAKRVEKAAQEKAYIEEIRAAGKLPKKAVIHLSPTPLDVKSLSFDGKHINQERSHNVTRQMAEQWIREAKISVTVWNGKYERYFAEEGAVYVKLLDKTIRTAYHKSEFDDRVKAIMEVIKSHESR